MRASRVKHLNPRQGITTEHYPGIGDERRYSVKHLNPRQGITTLRIRLQRCCIRTAGVKHLNPRQGITTAVIVACCDAPHQRVKHLNPRQGITTFSE